MPISTKSQEEISISYFSAVAAKANAAPEIKRRDEDGIDAFVTKNIALADGVSLDSTISFQIKTVYSSSNYHFDSNADIIYKLKVKNYNDLVRGSNLEKYLALLIMPSDPETWVEQTSDQLTIKKCMYYVSLKGLLPSANEETVSITIPKENVFDVSHLNSLLYEAIGED